MSRIARAAAVVALVAAPLLASAAPASAGPELPECEIGMRPSMPPQLYYHCPPL